MKSVVEKISLFPHLPKPPGLEIKFKLKRVPPLFFFWIKSVCCRNLAKVPTGWFPQRLGRQPPTRATKVWQGKGRGAASACSLRAAWWWGPGCRWGLMSRPALPLRSGSSPRRPFVTMEKLLGVSFQRVAPRNHLTTKLCP